MPNLAKRAGYREEEERKNQAKFLAGFWSLCGRILEHFGNRILGQGRLEILELIHPSGRLLGMEKGKGIFGDDVTKVT